MTASVNNFFQQQNLIDNTLAGFTSELGKLNSNHSGSFYHIIYKQSINGGRPVRMDSSDFIAHLHCCRNTVTNINNRLEALGILTVTHVDTYPNGKKHTVNYYSINWERAIVLLKEKIFGASLGAKYNFILKKTVAFFKSYRAQVLGTLILSSNEDIYIYNNIFEFFKKIATIGEGIFNRKEKTVNEPLEGEVLDPISYMLVYNNAGKKQCFDETIKECPAIYRQNALNKYSFDDRIEENFQSFKHWHIENKMKRSCFLRAWDNWLIRSDKYFIDIKLRDSAVLDQSRRKEELKQNGTQLSLPTSKQGAVSYIKNIFSAAEPRIPWNKELANESFWKIPGNPDNSQFNTFYTSKGADIMDTKAGWLQRGIKWHERSRSEKSPSVKAYGDAKPLEVKLPDQLTEIHTRLMNRLGEPNYIAWVQIPKVTIQEYEDPMDHYRYSANYTACGNAFTKSTVRERYIHDFNDLKIQII